MNGNVLSVCDDFGTDSFDITGFFYVRFYEKIGDMNIKTYDDELVSSAHCGTNHKTGGSGGFGGDERG